MTANTTLYTAFVQDRSGSHGTTYINTVTAGSIEEAIAIAESEAATEWDQDADTVKCVGLALGEVKIAHWDDDN